MADSVATDVSNWGLALAYREHPLILYSAGVLCLAPLFSFAFLSVKLFYARAKCAVDGSESRAVFMLWLWVLVLYIYLSQPWDIFGNGGGKEQRYFYMAYPALACLAAFGIEKLRGSWAANKRKAVFADLVIAGLFVIYALKAVPWTREMVTSVNMLF
jgi:hypothetical protein